MRFSSRMPIVAAALRILGGPLRVEDDGAGDDVGDIAPPRGPLQEVSVICASDDWRR